MPKRTAEIILGGDKYTVHAFNIGELEQLAGIIANGGVQDSGRSFAILKLALLRAEPAIDDVDSIEATIDEVRIAVDVLMQLAGLKAAENPPQAPAAA